MAVMGRSRRDITILKGLQTLVGGELDCSFPVGDSAGSALSEQDRALSVTRHLQVLSCWGLVNREVDSLATARASVGPPPRRTFNLRRYSQARHTRPNMESSCTCWRHTCVFQRSPGRGG